MRVTNNMIYRQSYEGMEKNNQRYLEVNRKINEQSNIVKPSDDPVGAAQVMQYDAKNKLLTQYQTNATLAKNSLEYQEVSMDSLNSLLDKSRTLIIQAENSSNAQADVDAIAKELELMTLSMVDLMNSKSSDGSYIFAGANSKSPPFELQADGRYVFNGDEGQRHTQLSERVSIAVTDSGKGLFQDVFTRHTFSAGAPSSGNVVQSRIFDQGVFDTYVEQNYDAVNTVNNQLSLVTTAGAPDTFTVQNSSGVLVSSGNYVPGEPMKFLGMEVTLDANAGVALSIGLDAPTRDNVVNQLQQLVGVMRDPALSIADREATFRDATVSISNTQESISIGRSALGARLNTISQMEGYSSSAKISNASASEAIGGLDIAAASSELVQTQAAITASQQLFTRLSSLSLFSML